MLIAESTDRKLGVIYHTGPALLEEVARKYFGGTDDLDGVVEGLYPDAARRSRSALHSSSPCAPLTFPW